MTVRIRVVDPPNLPAAMREAYAAGLSVWPTTTDGLKRPDGRWKLFQTRRPTAAELQAVAATAEGFGVFPGPKPEDADPAVRAALPIEAMDFDDLATYQHFLEDADATELLPLVERIEAGYCDETPNGGRRWLYRCAEVSGNTVLAKRPATAAEVAASPGHRETVLVETRGTGGFAIVAPSNGRTHPTGRPYVRRSGGFASIVTISREDRAALFRLLQTFDQMPKAAPREALPQTGGELRPGDDFNTRGRIDEALPADWVRVYTRGDNEAWRRPGKNRGISATWHRGLRVFYLFSSSTALRANDGHSLFQVYAGLQHGGDHTAAAQALARKGYGTSMRARADSPATQLTDKNDSAPSTAGAQVRPARFPPDTLEDAVDVAAEGRAIEAAGVPYLVEGIIPAFGMLGFLVAYAKVGKTTFGQALGGHVAQGAQFLGRDTQTARVLVVAAEDPPEYTAWLARSLSVPRGQMLFYRRPWGATAAGLSDLAATISAEAVGFVLIASWQAVVRGLVRDENDNAGAVAIVEDVKAAARATRIPWLIDAHSGKGEDQADEADPLRAMRGASGAAGAADYMLSLRYANGTFGTRRKLSGKGRFVSLAPLVFDWDAATTTYDLIGSSQNVACETTWRLIEELGALTTTPQTLADLGRTLGWVNGKLKLTGSKRRHLTDTLRGRPEVFREETLIRGQKTMTYRLGGIE